MHVPQKNEKKKLLRWLFRGRINCRRSYPVQGNEEKEKQANTIASGRSCLHVRGSWKSKYHIKYYHNCASWLVQASGSSVYRSLWNALWRELFTAQSWHSDSVPSTLQALLMSDLIPHTRGPLSWTHSWECAWNMLSPFKVAIVSTWAIEKNCPCTSYWQR